MVESIRKMLFTNLPLKMIALVLSMVLFLVVRSDRGTVTTIEVPLHLRVADDFVVVNEPSEAVRVQIRGTWAELRELRADELGPILVSPPPRVGQTTITFDVNQIALPPGLTVESFDPPSMQIEQDERATKTVPVAVKRALSGEPPGGYQVGELTADPPRVEIVGPRSVIQTVSQVFVEPIDLTGRTVSFVEERFVVSDRRLVDVVGEGRVTVSIEVVPKARQRVAREIPVLILNLSRPFEVLPEAVDLVLIGEEEALVNADTSKVVVTLDGGSEETGPGRSRQLVVQPKNVYNLPPGVAVDESRLPTVFLRTHSAPQPVPPIPVPSDNEPPPTEPETAPAPEPE